MSLLDHRKYETWLVPYLEGSLDETRRAQLEARLRADPRLAAEAERLGRTLGHLRRAGQDAPPAAPADVPADLWPRLRARLEAEAAPPRRPRPVPVWGAAGVGLAAALALLFLWLPLWHTPAPTRVAVAMPPPTVSLPTPAAPSPTAPTLAPAAPPSTPPPAQGTVRPAIPAHIPLPPASRDPFALAPPVAAPSSAIAARNSGAAPLPPTTGYIPPSLPSAPPAPFPQPAAKPPTLMASRLPKTDGGGLPVLKPEGRDAYDSAAPQAAPATVNVAPPSFAAPAHVSPAPTLLTPQEQAPQTAAGGATRPQGEAQSQSQPNNLYQAPGVALDQNTIVYGASSRRGKSQFSLNQSDRFNGQQMPGGWLDARQAELAAATQPPLLGENTGAQQAAATLMAVRAAGALDALRARLEAKRAESPQDVGTGRMLAAVYEFSFQRDLTLRERRRVAGLDGAVGEDWFALAQAEERGGSLQAARAAYRRALDAPGPLSAFHAALARGRV